MTEVIKIRMKDSKFHDEMSRIFLALNCRHFNREQEYHKKCEDMAVRALERFWQHYSSDGSNIYIKDFDVEDIFTSKNLGMSDKFNRFDVNSEMVKNKIKAYYHLWEEVTEKAVMALEEKYISMLIGLKKPFLAHRIMEEIESFAEELKRVRVCIVEYELSDYNPAVICSPSYIKQHHDKYKDKAKEVVLEDYI